MSVKELKEMLEFITDKTKDGDLPIVFEHRAVWQTYHLSPGMSRRYHKGKEMVVVRLEE